MSYQVFARKYRPQTFDDLLGQDHVVQTLRNAIEQKRLAHAYLFVGPRGTGKTSMARIFAKALNAKDGPRLDFDPNDELSQEIAEGRSLDVLEIDGASNNGVEQVRDLRDTVQYAPASCPFKIIYIDEVHMLSNAAFNALLKTLEEPPPHVKFIFATTEPNKILATIISRCQRFDLRPIPTDIIAKQLLNISQKEGVTLEETAAWTIAKGADGGMRDAQSMLDQLVAFCGNDIKEAQVLEIFGFTSHETVNGLSQAIFSKNTAQALAIIHEQETSGKNLQQLLSELIGTLRGVLVAKLDPANTGVSSTQIGLAELIVAAEKTNLERLLNIVDIFAEADGRMKWATHKRLHLEMALIRAIHSLDEILIDDIIKSLEGAPANGSGTLSPPPEAPTTPAAPAPTPSAPPAATEPEPTNQVPETPPPAQDTPPPPSSNAPGNANDNSTESVFDSLRSMAVDERPEEPPAPRQEQASAPPAADQPPREPQKANPDEFYNDELIQAALKKFNAKIVS